jgi:hypothetical protein
VAESKSDFRLPRPALLNLKAELAKRAISASVLARAEGLFAQWDADPRILVNRKTSQVMGDHGPTYEIIIEGRGELDVIPIDGRIRIFVDSIYRRLILKMVEADGAQKKAKPIPVNLIKARDERARASRKRARERELAAAPSKRAGRSKKLSELSTTPAE